MNKNVKQRHKQPKHLRVKCRRCCSLSVFVSISRNGFSCDVNNDVIGFKKNESKGNTQKIRHVFLVVVILMSFYSCLCCSNVYDNHNTTKYVSDLLWRRFMAQVTPILMTWWCEEVTECEKLNHNLWFCPPSLVFGFLDVYTCYTFNSAFNYINTFTLFHHSLLFYLLIEHSW